MTFSEFLKNNIICLDGGMGTLLQASGLAAGEHPERWNISRPEVITDIQKRYCDAGANVISTNTFGANSLKFDERELEDIIRAAIGCARAAIEKSTSQKERFVALDIGPTGRLLAPLGDLDFEDAVEVFAKTVRLGVKYGADLILIETMNDAYETKAALLAAKENSSLPVIVSNAYGADGKLMTGATPAAMVALLEGMGADVIGANCSLGPKQLSAVADELLDHASCPVLIMPNAGIPSVVDGKTVFDVTPEEFASDVAELVARGVRAVGGCCGTTPEYIGALNKKLAGVTPAALSDKNETVISSYTHAVTFGGSPVLIGERLNPTGKKRFKQALVEEDMDYILREGVRQEEAGVHALDVNVGIPEIDEPRLLERAVRELQAVTALPLQIDTASPAAMEKALRRYNGKALVNSVNGKEESMHAVFPLVKKYGGVVIALTLDESGIPADADGRVEIAKRIIATAESYGIKKKDLIFDTLAMTVSADPNAAKVTLESLRRIKEELGAHTSLGVSNVSFGLPARDTLNATFFALALRSGLSAAIMNPYSDEMMRTFFAYRALMGYDKNFEDYISAASGFVKTESAPATSVASPQKEGACSSELQRAVVKGFRAQAGELAEELLKTTEPLDIVKNEIIPALDEVGEGFERKTVYLPQLLMSAEAAQSAFEAIKRYMSREGKSDAKKGAFVLATVKGDIHDIGKNIVKLLLENYGFRVIDLGRDVPPERIVEAAIEHRAELVGLSALMPTTVPAMEETIKLLREKAPECRCVVGGAVLTKEYAERIGADKYAKDAMEAVRYAEEIFNNR